MKKSPLKSQESLYPQQMGVDFGHRIGCNIQFKLFFFPQYFGEFIIFQK